MIDLVVVCGCIESAPLQPAAVQVRCQRCASQAFVLKRELKEWPSETKPGEPQLLKGRCINCSSSHGKGKSCLVRVQYESTTSTYEINVLTCCHETYALGSGFCCLFCL
jgi:hypothetical protein